MGKARRWTNEEVITAYRETGSVWAAGKRLGTSGQSVHARLKELQYPMARRNWTPDEDAELRVLLDAHVTLAEAARRLGRSFAGAACRANELQLKVKRQPQIKLPRGGGWDKASTKKHLDRMQSFPGKATQYARANGLDIEMLVIALQRHFPEAWEQYVRDNSDYPPRKCTYCERDYYPNNGKQLYCTRHCATQARADRGYFGGKRRNTIGLAQEMCQLCGRKGVRGLTPHHILGKENDPENDALVALCQGCHKVVTLLATRKFVDNPQAWQDLITLAWFRKHGADPAISDTSLYVEVILERQEFAEGDGDAHPWRDPSEAWEAGA